MCWHSWKLLTWTCSLLSVYCPRSRLPGVCQCDDNMVQRLETDFKMTLQQQSTLEQWAAWLDNVMMQAQRALWRKTQFPKAARQFLLKWSFYENYHLNVFLFCNYVCTCFSEKKRRVRTLVCRNSLLWLSSAHLVIATSWNWTRRLLEIKFLLGKESLLFRALEVLRWEHQRLQSRYCGNKSQESPPFGKDVSFRLSTTLLFILYFRDSQTVLP